MKDGLAATPEIGVWLNKNLPTGSKVGTDPMVMSFQEWTRIQKILDRSGLTLVPIQENLVDLVWKTRPEPVKRKITNLDLKYAGRTIASKLKEIREELTTNDAECLVVTALDEVAYLLNLRGSDISYNPLFFSYVIVTLTDVLFFVDSSKLTHIDEHFKVNEVEVKILPYESVKETLSSLVISLITTLEDKF